MKITIEGYEGEPIVLEGITEFALYTEDDTGYEYIAYAGEKFLGYVEAQSRVQFEGCHKEEIEDEGAGVQ